MERECILPGNLEFFVGLMEKEKFIPSHLFTHLNRWKPLGLQRTKEEATHLYCNNAESFQTLHEQNHIVSSKVELQRNSLSMGQSGL